MNSGQLRRALHGVRHVAAFAVEAILVEKREAFRRLERSGLPLRIDGAEEEHAIPDDRSSALYPCIVYLRRQRLDGPVLRLVLLPRAFESRRARVRERGPVKGVRAALGDDIHDAAHRLAELGFVAAALDLDLLEEIERHGGAE